MFVFGFIYLSILICGSFTLGRLFNSIFAYFWFNGVLYFSSKNLLCGKRFLINCCSFYMDIVFSGKKKIIV
jgi:hypothetical protein